MSEKTRLPTRDEYPSNNRYPLTEKEVDEKVNLQAATRRVVKGRVLRRKKTLTSGFTEAFFGDQLDLASVIENGVQDILMPAIKATLSDLIASSIDMLLYGESRGSRRKKPQVFGSTISYGNFYQNIASGKNERRHITPGRKIEDVVLEDKGEAEDVIEALIDQLDRYEYVSVGDLYELIGMEVKHTHNKYGWTNLSKASVKRIRGGYLLDLPMPIELEL